MRRPWLLGLLLALVTVGIVAALVDSDRLRPVVQSTHPLEQVRPAVEEAMAGVRGKVVLTVGGS